MLLVVPNHTHLVKKGLGLYLICGGPVTDDTCYVGGCGAPVIIAECRDDDPEQ